MSRSRQVLALLALFLLTSAHPALLASQPSPVATPAGPTVASRLDLAAMALTVDDIPAGFHQPIFDNEGYTHGDRMSAIQTGGAVPQDEIDATNLAWAYTSTFFNNDGSEWIHAYVSEHKDEAGARAAFDLFEDEATDPSTPETCTDESGPAVGDEPKEITVCSEPLWNGTMIDATFRVGRVLAGVTTFTTGDDPDTGLIEELAATFHERIELVLAGEAPSGTDLSLAPNMLPVFDTWRWPGNSLEGYKTADEFLGTEGDVSALSSDYVMGYAIFVSSGADATDFAHDPPYIDIEISEFTSPDVAREALGLVDTLPQRHSGMPVAREPIDAPEIEGSEEVVAFAVDRPALIGDPSSLHLAGTSVSFTSGPYLVTLMVTVDADARGANPEETRAMAADLATQQAGCLASACRPFAVPEGMPGGS